MGNGDEPVDDDLTYALDPLSDEVVSVAQAIMERWEDGPESPYAGVVVDQPSGIVTVYRVAGDPAFDDEVLSHRTERVSVALVDVPRNKAANEQIMRSILAENDLPIHMYVVGVGPDGTGADVIAEGDLAAAQSILDDRYGDGFVRLERGQVRLL
ncbi:MAG: hypothetical protein LCI03_00830 [Actinobacteria bacterium]|nr:hypothetical protein [Actinomycetota bacterium]